MKMNGFADTLITVFPVIRLFDAEALILSKYNTTLEEWERASLLEKRRRAKLMSLSALLSCIPLLLLFLVGGIQIIQDSQQLAPYMFLLICPGTFPA